MPIPLTAAGSFYDCPFSNELIPVSCIASFSRNGGVRPQHIQVVGENGEKVSLRVGKIHSFQDHTNCDITFHCDILEEDVLKTATLYYDRKRDRWFLKRQRNRSLL